MRKLFFIGIIILAAFLRLWQLGVVPVSPDWDEAALGYNAYSILKTGRDEYGTFLPRTLRSFDDYKPPLYTYLAIPSVAVFGLSTWATRLPSAVMGILAVIGTYYLVTLLIKKKDDSLALLSALFLAISPWHLQFSRIAFEANTGVTLNIWGLVAFFRGLTSLPWMAFAAFLFGISLYAYHSERIFVPLLLIVISVLWRKELFADTKKIAIGIVIGLLTVAPLVPVLLDKSSVTRLKGTSTLSDTTGLLMRSVKKLEDDIHAGDRIGAIFENRRIVYARTLADGYISHFSLRWLFLTGDNDRHHAPDNGLLYFFELPFLLLGFFILWKKGGKLATLITSWILLAPLAASPTSETPHAIRSLVVLPVLQLCIAAGVYESYGYGKALIRKSRGIVRAFGISGGILVCLAIAANIVFYFHMYYVHLNREYSPFWQYGYAQAVRYAEANKHKYEKIVVSTKLEQPHMFFLFYTKFDPATYLAAGGTASGGFKEVRNRFDKYEFRPIPNWADEKHDGTVLYIGAPTEIPGSPMVISYLHGPDAIRISE